MDATGAIVVLIFVITIFSSLNGGNISVPGAGGGNNTAKVSITERLNVQGYPDPYYISVSGEDAQGKIEQFIIKKNKNLSYWDAGLMSSAMMKYGGIYNVNPKIVCALIARESTFKTDATSSSGAMGLGQLLPATAKSLNVGNAYDPEQNIMGTTRYVSFLLEKWKAQENQVPLALASYAEGHNAISRNGGYSYKTKTYVEDIIKLYWQI
jgi:hypothetical protein